MKKLFLVLCLILSGCTKYEDPSISESHKLPEEIATNSEIENNNETFTASSADSEKTDYKAMMDALIHDERDQKTADLFDEIVSSRYDNAVFTAVFANQQTQVQSFDSNQITRFFSLLKNGEIITLNESQTVKDNDLKIDLIASNAMNQHIHCQYIFNEADPMLILLDNTDEYQIHFKSALDEPMYNYFQFLKLGIDVDAVDADNYEQQFIDETDITAEYDKTAYLFKEDLSLSEGLIRKSFGDAYGQNSNDLNRILAMLFYTGEMSSAPSFDEGIFRYIILNHESERIIGGDVEALSEITFMRNGVEETIFLDRPIAGYSILMNGEVFRSAYRQLFNQEFNWDESKSYHSGVFGRDGYGYFADHDLYYYACYCLGAIGGYTGWNLLIEDVLENDSMVNVKLLDFYTNYDWIGNDNYAKLYDKDWQPVSIAELGWAEGLPLRNFLLNHRDLFLQWEVKLLHREDGSYAFLSASCLNQIEPYIMNESMIEIVKKPMASILPSDLYLMPQFTISGLDAYLINQEIADSSSSVRGFIVENDDKQVTVKAIDRYLLPFKDQYLYFVKDSYTYDKTTQAFINAEKILARKQYY